MKKVITYGTFDLLHQGHINLLRRAKELGDYLIVGITTDNFDLERGKINTHDSIVDRIEAVKATGYADKIIIEEYAGQKIDDIQKYGVDIFAIGSDWVGKFDYLKEYCDVVYLPRTEGISSTQIRNEQTVRFGIAGTGSIARRFVPESRVVSCANISAAYSIDREECLIFCKSFGIPLAVESYGSLLEHCDAVYVATPHYTHYQYVKEALLAGKHVLCETPFVLSTAEARELLAIAKERNLILAVAHKTAYCPAFRHLVSMLKSGVIGDIVDINASVTTILDENSSKMSSDMHGGSMNENACFPILPIIKLMGTDYRDISFYSKMKNGVDIFTKAVFRFDSSTASFQVGLGAKTEGNMVVSGTQGYVYIPAPWWKTDYFEFRFEDQNRNKPFFLPFSGEGLRYEIREFINAVLLEEHTTKILSEKEILAMTDVQERYLKEENLFRLA